MVPDIVLYVRGGENEELRYAIRTWCQYLDFGKLCVTGGPFPTWLHPDIAIINKTDRPLMQQCYQNLTKALSNDLLTDEVIIMMDDVFLLKPAGTWRKNGNRGTLQDQYDRMKKKTSYSQLIKNTWQELKSRKISTTLSFEEHAPFRCDRKKLLDLLQEYGEEKIAHLLWRSLYGNIYHIDSDYVFDQKLPERTTAIPHAPVISTNERSWAGTAGIVIQDWFQKPSKYEH